jgi:hypothetical protein
LVDGVAVRDMVPRRDRKDLGGNHGKESELFESVARRRGLSRTFNSIRNDAR